MGSKRMTRREAVAKLTVFTAAAMGLDAAEIGRLADQIRKVEPTKKLDLNRLATIKPTTSVGKFLKVIVIAREDVFVSEFGRDAVFGMERVEGGICPVFVNFSGGTNSVNDCGKNTCGTQDCPELFCSGTNDCGKQDCGKQRMPGNSNLFATPALDRIRTDPFVQALFKEFNVTTTQALSQNLIDLVSQKRPLLKR